MASTRRRPSTAIGERVCGAWEGASGGRPGRFGDEPEREAGGPLTKEKDFSLIFVINSPKSPILSTKNLFSKGDSKIEVVQNFILYNLALGFMLKFQLDFELEI
jgi:hypothetical protein